MNKKLTPEWQHVGRSSFCVQTPLQSIWYKSGRRQCFSICCLTKGILIIFAIVKINLLIGTIKITKENTNITLKSLKCMNMILNSFYDACSLILLLLLFIQVLKQTGHKATLDVISKATFSIMKIYRSCVKLKINKRSPVVFCFTLKCKWLLWRGPQSEILSLAFRWQVTPKSVIYE